MDNQLISLIEKIVEKKIKEMQPMTREPAVVLSSDSENGTARVRFLSGSEYELLNKTSEVLSEGDSVWVEYRTLPSAGYIAMRNGKAVGLYEEAMNTVENGLVTKFKTHVKDVKRGAFSQSVSSTSLEVKICDIEPTDKALVLHISSQEPSHAPSMKADIDHFVVRSNGQPVYFPDGLYPTWIGKEAYLTSTAVWPHDSWWAPPTELYAVFSTTGLKKFNYELFRINAFENSYSDPPKDYTQNIEPHGEGAGSISYSEFVRYVSEEITSAKQRLDALEGQ